MDSILHWIFRVNYSHIFQLEKTNVFQLSILLPLLKIFDIYTSVKNEISADEFCIFLFVTKPIGKCSIDYNPTKHYISINLEEFKVKVLHY